MNFAVTLPRFFQIRIPFLLARAPRQLAGAQIQERALPRHATLRLDNRALQLRVLHGCVWITRDGCPADLVLEAGAVFEQRPGAPVLVHALADAEVVIEKVGRDA